MTFQIEKNIKTLKGSVITYDKIQTMDKLLLFITIFHHFILSGSRIHIKMSANYE